MLEEPSLVPETIKEDPASLTNTRTGTLSLLHTPRGAQPPISCL